MSNPLEKYSRFKKLNVRKVVVPGWDDETVYLREMDSDCMAEWLRQNEASDADGEFSPVRAAAVIVLHLCDENGELLVPKEDREAVTAELAGHKFRVLTLLLTEALKASGLADTEIEAAQKK